MKVGLFINNFTSEKGGVKVSVKNLVKDLEEAGHKVYIITNNKENNTNDFKNPDILKIKKTPFINSDLFYKLDTLDLDIIKMHSGVIIRTIAKRYARKRHKPFIQIFYHSLHEHFINKYGVIIGNILKLPAILYTKYICNTADRIICSSENLYRLLTHEYNISRNIDIVAPGIKLDMYRKVDQEEVKKIKNKYDINNDDFLLLALGTIDMEQCLDEVLKSLSNLRDCPNIKLMIVGVGKAIPFLKNLASRLLLHNVIFVGGVERDQVPAYYHSATLLVENTKHAEQGITIMESLAASLPVICYDNKVHTDMIKHNQNGIIYKNMKSFEEECKRLYINWYQTSIMKEYAMLSSNKFSNQFFIQRIEAIYKEETSAKRNRD